MAIRKNTRRFDPRYFMDEKTDVIKEGLNPANMNQTPFGKNPEKTKELIATIQSVAGRELDGAVQWFKNRPSKEEDPYEYQRHNQAMMIQGSPVHRYTNAVDDAMRNNEIYDKLYPWASAGYEGLEGTLINLASWMAKPKPENIEEDLSADDRRALPDSDFALAGKGEGPEGKQAGSYPIPDEKHARSALSLVAQHGTPEEKAKVRAAVKKNFPGIKQEN